MDGPTANLKSFCCLSTRQYVQGRLDPPAGEASTSVWWLGERCGITGLSAVLLRGPSVPEAVAVSCERCRACWTAIPASTAAVQQCPHEAR